MVSRLRKTKLNQSRRSTHQFTHLNLPIRSSLKIKFVQSDHPPICSFIYQSIHRFIHTYINPFIFLHICSCSYLYMFSYNYLFVCPPIHSPTYLSIHHSVRYFLCVSFPVFHSSTHLYIHVSTDLSSEDKKLFMPNRYPIYSQRGKMAAE